MPPTHDPAAGAGLVESDVALFAGAAPQRSRGWLSTGARYRLRNRLLDTPVLSELFVLLSPPLRRYARLAEGTELLIDGFPRSGNSYAVTVFRLANPGTTIVSHLHTPRSVRRAVRRGIPVVVLLREPRSAIASMIQFLGDADGLDASVLVQAYRRYYRGIERVLDAVVIADFARAVTDFGAVIERCNERFGTRFTRYVATAESEAAAVKIIDSWTEAAVPHDRLLSVYPRPTPERAPADVVLADISDDAKAAMAEAEAMYRRLLARSLH